ncbi:MAG TPA: glycogen debranching N-terminal domain-containing protein [Rhizomicrobium sp.]|nr:glycogen debranching N-terminal domain-containing protein [Rhizomicrobium sp.]
MEETVRQQAADEISSYTIQAKASIQDQWPRILKSGDMFALFNQFGDVPQAGATPGGIFYNDTRHLSDLELLLNGQKPLLLSSAVDDDNVLFTIDISNPDIYRDGKLVLPSETLHVRRTKLLWQGTCYERIAVRNFDRHPQRCWLTIRADADFTDLFEIRGMVRMKRGKRTVDQSQPDVLAYRYAGLDKIERITRIRFSPAPRILENGEATYLLELPPKGHVSLFVTIECDQNLPASETFSKPCRAARKAAREDGPDTAQISIPDPLVEKVLCRASADLNMLVTQTAWGPYPYAGTPWFNTPFGRDGLITALQILWVEPGLAKGVLHLLAAHQATEENALADAQPGKILHEMRNCEMSHLGEVPFGLYYGSVDSTPLFVLLAGRYFERTGDLQTVERLWPNVDAALGWIDKYGDRDGDGFVEYFRQSPDGLANQGWKDSHDAIMHADGSLARGPIALCEVQGYVYAAKRGAASLARALGMEDRAKALEDSAETLRKKFEESFWCEELGVYALALDGDKLPCRVRTSNSGQVLMSGIASPERAARVTETLLLPECFSGWGVRTLSSQSPRYNPMSYHNGSIWPHDNALIAIGMGRYGLRHGALTILRGIYDAALRMDLMRLPELFCGFPRRTAAPTLYPVACMPQAWAAVAPYALLEACLGMTCDFARMEIRFNSPILPDFLDGVRIENLCLGDASVDLTFRCDGDGVAISTLARRGDIGIRISK